MKISLKVILSITFLAAAEASYAQATKVVSAYNFLQDKKFAEAAALIDEAVLNEKTMASEKTWRYRGQIYAGIAASKDPKLVAAYPKAAMTSIESFVKANSLDAKKSYEQENKIYLINAQIAASNAGIVAYNAKDYSTALDNFLIAAKGAEILGNIDTNMTYNAALSADLSGNMEVASEQYDKCIKMGYLGSSMYVYKANMLDKAGKKEEYIKTVKAGRAQYPNEKELLLMELNDYIANGKMEEAKGNLIKAIEAEPTNKSLHFALGVTCDNLANPKDKDGKDLPKPANSADLMKQAETSYAKAIELDPNYGDANYNLGAMYFNTAVEKYNKANSISDTKKYNAEMLEVNKSFSKAQPFLEKAFSIMPDDRNCMISLKELYLKTGDTAKFTEIKTKLDALK
jgi:hypothetical protein